MIPLANLFFLSYCTPTRIGVRLLQLLEWFRKVTLHIATLSLQTLHSPATQLLKSPTFYNRAHTTALLPQGPTVPLAQAMPRVVIATRVALQAIGRCNGMSLWKLTCRK